MHVSICIWSRRNLSAHVSRPMEQSFSLTLELTVMEANDRWAITQKGNMGMKEWWHIPEPPVCANLWFGFLCWSSCCLVKVCAEMGRETPRHFVYVYFQTSFECVLAFCRLFTTCICSFFKSTYNYPVNRISLWSVTSVFVTSLSP